MVRPSASALSCRCGQLRGRIDPARPGTGLHLICHCRDCRAAERYLGQPDPGPGGVDLFQTTPDTIHIDTGAEQLAILRLSPNGPLRWYGVCCKTPLFNTLARPGLPFATVMVARLEQPECIGPVKAEAFVPQPGGAPRHRNGTRMVWGVLRRMITSRLSGRWRTTPFFDPNTGEPVAPIHVIGKEERAALRT